MLVKDIMTKECDLTFLVPDMTIQEAAQKMKDAKRPHGGSAKGMLVKKEGGQLGMLSVKDLLEAVRLDCGDTDLSKQSWEGQLLERAQKPEVRSRTVRECMTNDVICVFPETTLARCERLMNEHGLQRMPVINEEGEIQGMVYIRDLSEVVINALINGDGGE